MLQEAEFSFPKVIGFKPMSKLEPEFFHNPCSYEILGPYYIHPGCCTRKLERGGDITMAHVACRSTNITEYLCHARHHDARYREVQGSMHQAQTLVKYKNLV